MCTAIFKANTEMANDPKYNEDQTAFRNLIGKAEDAPSELIEKFGKLELTDKLDKSGLDLVTTSLQAPPAACNTNAILLEMSKQQELLLQLDQQVNHWDNMQDQRVKHWGDIHMQQLELWREFRMEQAKLSAETQAQIAKHWAESQVKIAEAIKIACKPKYERKQPTFSPKPGDDPTLYTAFKQDFEHFIAEVDPEDWPEKTYWLLQCVKNDAYKLIEYVSLNEAGYTQAFQDLDKMYLRMNEIKDRIFNFIHTFSVSNTGKNHSTLWSKLITLRGYIQQLTNYHGFEMTVSLSEFIGHIIMKSLPNDVRNKFYDITDNLYPDYNAILSKVDYVIEYLSKIGKNTRDSTIKHNPNKSKGKGRKAQSINSVSNQPTNTSKSSKRKKKDCSFCKSSDHTSSNCTKYLSPESRIAALRKLEGSEICHRCIQKHSGKCKDRFQGCCYLESCKSNPHQFTVCPIKCRTLATKLSKNSSRRKTVVELPDSETEVSKVGSPSSDHLPDTPEVIGDTNINGKKRRSVSLETLTLTISNDNCSSKSLQERGVGALLDSGAQRTMITAETVNRLGIQVFEREAAT